MNKAFLLPFYSRKSLSEVCKNFNISKLVYRTTNQERPVLVHAPFEGILKTFLDSGFHAVDLGFQLHNSGFP